jgi:hypothetical protein
MYYESLEPLVRKILSERYERKLPPDLFVNTHPEREKLKERYRETIKEAVIEYELENETDEETIAKSIAEYVNEMISEEILNPCPEDWD